MQIFPKAAASTNSDVQADMGRHYEEGSGGYRDDTYDDSYDGMNGASGDGSGDGKSHIKLINIPIILKKYFLCRSHHIRISYR